MEQILLPPHYFEGTKIEVIELSSLHHKNEDGIRNGY